MPRRKKDKWVEAGFVSVGSGEILIADPAAVASDSGIQAIDQWFENVTGRNFDKFEASFTTQSGQEVKDVGLFSRTGYGDGYYRIWARINEDSRVAELRIDFETTYGYDDESKEMHDISQKETMRRLAERQQNGGLKQTSQPKAPLREKRIAELRDLARNDFNGMLKKADDDIRSLGWVRTDASLRYESYGDWPAITHKGRGYQRPWADFLFALKTHAEEHFYVTENTAFDYAKMALKPFEPEFGKWKYKWGGKGHQWQGQRKM